MKGYLVYNSGLKSEKFEKIHSMYEESAKRYGIELKKIKNSEIYMDIFEGDINKIKKDIDFVLFLDKDVNLAMFLEKLNFKVFNSSETIRISDSKILSHLKLAGKNIKMPKTIIAPFCYFNMEVDENYIRHIEENLSYPLILKEAYGSFGSQVYMIKDRQELLLMIKKLKNTPHIYQEFVKSSYGKDVRVNVVGNEAVAWMYRESNDDFRSNISSGGSMKKIDLPESFKNMAIESAKIIGADFAGVDLMFDIDGSPIFCEINSNAHIKNIYELTGINVADKIFEYILKICDLKA